MVGGLHYDTGRDMPPGMQEMAARSILSKEAGVMLQVLKEVDADCQFCARAGMEQPCAAETPIPLCKDCQRTECPCFGCVDNSGYRWCGAEEALKRLSQIAERRERHKNKPSCGDAASETDENHV